MDAMPDTTSTVAADGSADLDIASAQPGDGAAIWIGQHAVDGDILVFDTTESDPTAARLAFYSLTQFRVRTFPRSIVAEHIRPVADEARAQKLADEYARRDELQQAHTEAQERERASAAADQVERQRAHIVALHRDFVQHHEVEYAGVQPSAESKPRRRLLSCRECGIALDDLLGLACGACNGVLCSCGACSCGKSKRSR
jgi:hypothetical protein